MRVLGSYFGSGLISGVATTLLLAYGWADPTAPTGALEVPGQLIALSPDFAIQTRRVDIFLTAAGPEATTAFKTVVAIGVFLILNVAAYVLHESTDDAWAGVPAWERPKPLWAALIFTAVTSLAYTLGILFQVPLLPRLALTPPGFAIAAFAGGLAFGFGRPRNPPTET